MTLCWRRLNTRFSHAPDWLLNPGEREEQRKWDHMLDFEPQALREMPRHMTKTPKWEPNDVSARAKQTLDPQNDVSARQTAIKAPKESPMMFSCTKKSSKSFWSELGLKMPPRGSYFFMTLASGQEPRTQVLGLWTNSGNICSFERENIFHLGLM